MKKIKKTGFFKDFAAFISKGNVLNLAVGIIIGAAFGKITASLVADIIMPPLGLLIGGVNYAELVWEIKKADLAAGTAAVTINYGNFIQTIIEFFIVALSIFIMIRLIMKVSNRIKKKKAEQKAAGIVEPIPEPEPIMPTPSEVYLAQIVELLRKENGIEEKKDA